MSLGVLLKKNPTLPGLKPQPYSLQWLTSITKLFWIIIKFIIIKNIRICIVPEILKTKLTQQLHKH